MSCRGESPNWSKLDTTEQKQDREFLITCLNPSIGESRSGTAYTWTRQALELKGAKRRLAGGNDAPLHARNWNVTRQPNMKLWVPAILLLALWAVVLMILWTPQVPNGHGFQHATFAAMDQGGDGANRHGPLFIAGWLLGSLLIAFFVSLLFFGTESRAHWLPFFLGGLIYEGVFGMLCLSYWKSLSDSAAVFLGPFPASVSWLLFGIWLIPAVFVVLYVAFFRRWIFPIESAREFGRLVEQRHNN